MIKGRVKYYKIAVLAVMLVALYAGANGNSLVPTSELSTTGYVQVQTTAGVSGSQGVVVLTGGCYQVVGNTDVWIADGISKGQASMVDGRPSIYDVTRDALNGFGIKVLMVKVIDLQNDTSTGKTNFIGRLILQQGNRIVSLDSRPSDATAIAVRAGAPVYVREDLMVSQGQKVC